MKNKTAESITHSKNRVASRLKTVFFWSACALAPIVMICALCAWGGIYPFGPESFLTEDLKYQYIDFFTWYREVLTGEANIFYSFAQGLGSNTWGLYSYYLASPFNLIILLFDEDSLTLAIFIIVALKLASMNVTATWFLKRRFGLTDTWSIILALCYTWSTWSVTNLRNPLWLDALIILPLAAWACWRLIRGGSFIPLAVLIAIDVICCWYMAYITLVFLCLFVLFELAVYLFDGNEVDRRWVLGRAWRFTGAVFLGLGLAAWTFVPTILAMLGGTGSKGISPFITYLTSLIRGFLPCAWNLNRVPQFYTGIIPLALALAALGSRRIPRKTRALLFCFAGLLAAASVFGHLEFIWCGMRVPNGFYSRTAFLLGFLEIWAAGLYLSRRTSPDPRAQSGAHYEPTRRRHAEKRRLSQPWINLAIGALALVDLTLNAHVCMRQLYVGYPQDAHEAYIAESSEQITRLKEIDPSPFWRLDKTYNRMGAAFNEGISLGFCQLSTYSSANSPHAVALLNSVGYSSEGEFSSVYAAPNLFMDSILGVRYAATWGTPAGYVPMDVEPSQNGATFSRNPYALSFGLPSAASAGELAAPLAGGNPFERMNDLARRLTGEDVQLFTELEANVNRSDSDHLAWEVSVPAGAIGYAYVLKGPDAGSYQPVQLTIDQQVIAQEGWRFGNNVRELNTPVENEPSIHRVAIDPAEGAEGVPAGTDCIFYALDMDVFDTLVTALRGTQFEPSSFEDGWVAGTYRTDQPATLLLSMPYDRGWTIVIDGQPTELLPALDEGMSAIQVDEGEHRIEMSYRSPGLTVGCAISALSLFALIACAMRAISTKRS